jgi:predicted nucleic acid-binding protein
MATTGEASGRPADSTYLVNDPIRVFADSNVVFSAARNVRSDLQNLWSLAGVEVVISQFVLSEVSAHSVHPDQRASLWRPVCRSHLVPDAPDMELSDVVNLPSKDRPILQAAIAAKADILVTGDRRHFGHLFGKTVSGVQIDSTSMFKNRFPEIFRREPK